MKKYLAKTDPEQTIIEHTDEVLIQLKLLFNLYGSKFTDNEKNICNIACQFHDFGKMNQIFQEKIRANKNHIDGEIPHGFLSPLFLDLDKLSEKYNDMEIKSLLTSIFYHHAREDKYVFEDYKDYYDKYIKDDIKEFVDGMNIDYLKKENYSFGYLHKRIFINSKGYSNHTDEIKWENYALIKGILNKCDYAASGKNLIELEGSSKNIEECILNKISPLKESQLFMQKNKNNNVILVAPTGSGKTEAALLWASDSKFFYTLPLKVASNSIYERILQKYKYKDITLLHSDSFMILKEENIDKYFISKNLSYPATICTIDQLFKFSFKTVGSEQYFATLKYSKLIIDEIQMYSSVTLACLIYGLKLLNDIGAKFAIVTATMPNLLKKLLKQEAGCEFEYKEITSGVKEKRHRIQIIDDDIDYELIVKNSINKKILIICNTVSKACEVYLNMKDKVDNLNLLHARFIKKDRSYKEQKILKFSNSDENGIWVTTQIVEASLDIDFDELHTCMSTADSLLQRMGRCYRNRPYDSTNPNIYIYLNKNGIGKVYDEEIYKISVAKLKKYDNCIMSEEDKKNYINAVFDDREILKTSYYNKIIDKLNILKTTRITEFNLNEIEKEFRDFNNITVMPLKFYDENINLFDRYDNSHDKVEKLNIKNEILEYCLSVNYNEYAKKLTNQKNNVNIPIIMFKYDSELGLINIDDKEDIFV